LVIADEAHHLGEDLAWGTGFARAFGEAARWLLLSGTPFRSDAAPIPGVRYDDGVAVPDVSYTYADAVREGICRPVTFIPYEGVHIPRLRVGVYATAAKTPLIFRQVVGRFVRTLPGRAPEMSWLYLPADPVLRAHAADVERELRHVLRPPCESDPAELDEPPE